MVLIVVLLVVTAVTARGLAEVGSLKGSKIYAIHLSKESHFDHLRRIENHDKDKDILQYPHVIGRKGKILVNKKEQASFEARMQSTGILFDVVIEDLESAIVRERRENDRAKRNAYREGKNITFTAYHRHSEINAYLDDLVTRYPNLVSITTQKTSEGRDLKAVTISTTGGTDCRKPVVIADAGIHAREWIAPATALYMIKKLVEDVTERDLVDEIDWVIVPLLNPDGYEYSHTKKKNRLWRKTRSRTSNPKCFGVDGNRNFDFKWMTAGSSSNPCRGTYAGSEPFSEPETRFLRDILVKYKGRTKAYIAIHSPGSYIVYPYGFNSSSTADDAEINTVGREMAAAIDKASLPGSKGYIVGNSGRVMYEVGGASDDYAYELGRARLSFTLELPGSGFELPPSKISQTVRETWQGIVVLGRHVIATS